MSTTSTAHVVFIDDMGNEEQRDLVNGHIVPIRLFDLNAFYTMVFQLVEQAIARGLTTGTLPVMRDNPFHHWQVV